MMQWALLLAVSGFVFIYLEFFVPGGLLAVLGASLLLLSLVLFGFSVAPWVLIIYLITIIILLLLLIKLAMAHIRKSKKSIYLEDDQEGYLASCWNQKMIGKKGVASSPLNPSGHVFVDNEYLQARSKTGFIKKGSPIKIIGGQGAYYLVELLNKDT